MNKDQHQIVTRIIFPFLVTIFFTTGLAVGFSQGGIIRGKVVADIPDQRRTLPGVVVTLSGERLAGKKLQTVSDAEGQYDFPALIAGDYIVTVEFSGFKKYEQRLGVQIEATVEHDILLQPVPLSESVTVTDDRTDASKTESTTPTVTRCRARTRRKLEHQRHSPKSERDSRLQLERHGSGYRRARDRAALGGS